MSKVVVFYSTIGNGHISVARAIAARIVERQPAASIVFKDIRAFMNPAWRAVDERLYWLVANNLPQSFDALFASFSDSGARACSLASISQTYDADAVLAFIEAEAPDSILATHYGAAQLLGGLREHGLLGGTPIGWVHTDYFVSYFPRISRRIDRTFVAHPELARRWLEAGVPESRVVATGMPVDVPTAGRTECRADLSGYGLSPDIFTVLIMTGRNGVGDQRRMIDSLVSALDRPLQIVAVCGTNASQRSQLSAHAATLPATVKLAPLGLVPHAAATRLIGAADVVVTKAGGVTPSEAFRLATPTVVLDVIGGHERENAEMFARCRLARVAPETARLGETVRTLIDDRQALADMRAAQAAYRQDCDLGPILDFALGEPSPIHALPPDFGQENGTPVEGIDAALAAIDASVPADIEVLLSYSTARTPQRIVMENPFGHIALRIGDRVFSANHLARPGRDPTILQHLALGEYLYGVHPPSPSQVHANTYGIAYGRETLSLRVKGVAPARRAAMLAEVAAIEGDYRRGRLVWDRRTENCADLVGRILAAGGWQVEAPNAGLGLPSMPLDCFDAADAVLRADAALAVRLVAYRQVPGSHADYRFSRFPLSPYQPLRSLSNTLRRDGADPLEGHVHAQLILLHGSRRLVVEALDRPAGARSGGERDARSVERAMLADLRALFFEAAREPKRRVSGLAASARHALAPLGSARAERLRQLYDGMLAHELGVDSVIRLARAGNTTKRLTQFLASLANRSDIFFRLSSRRAHRKLAMRLSRRAGPFRPKKPAGSAAARSAALETRDRPARSTSPIELATDNHDDSIR
ncbi:Glycosyltransferase family 28 protein [uncultured Pleomorphomonas sp.]|uniref:Glycosyltransferase family 28 protein n=1 Tax=uncultured Pleomorphomonas sp. TaxID=442121 RepID=A0A212L1M7_9HYPH|nr:UDP-N-acetylglucosamine 2-epimerase [uncultured Pleomorphomonas sp.]SCM71416.1 Glycosyltransferase family 28 protein [uncultured Pleomorphomonas sp.]